jgi:3,4-dihydroxy 2-butanone 4-phosphate synthase/GTP cyclohydrolase II
VERAGAALIPTMWGPFTANCYRSLLDGMEHIAMVKVRNLVFILNNIYGWEYA